MAFQRDGLLLDGSAQALGHLLQLGLVMHRYQGDEFFAAQACQQVLGPQRGAHAAGTFPQHLVTSAVAMLVIDLLEVVQVAVDHPQLEVAAE
ncbi:hypothetical protein D3C80_1674870 [compost metagenome]